MISLIRNLPLNYKNLIYVNQIKYIIENKFSLLAQRSELHPAGFIRKSRGRVREGAKRCERHIEIIMLL